MFLFYQFKAVDNLTGGIISFRNKNINLIKIIDDVSFNERYNMFSEGLIRLLGDILDPEKSFKQTEDVKKCLFCEFKSICNR